MLDPQKLRAVREVYLTARRNGLPPPRAQAHAARKAHELGCDVIRKYVNVIVCEMEDDSP